MAEFYHLNDGGLSAERPEGRRYLQRRSGRWRMVPSAADLLVFRRDEVGAPARGLRAVLTGDLEGFPVVDLLGYLAQARWNGSVTVLTGDQERRLVLHQGRLVAASSNHPGHRIGQVLRALGHLTEDELATGLATPRPDGTRLGQVLVADGVVTREQVQEATERRVQEVFFDLLAMDRGLFFLFNDPVEEPTGLALDLNFLLMEGLRRLDETTRHQEVIPHPAAWLTQAGEAPPETADQLRVWDAIGAGAHLGEVAEAVGMFPYDLYEALAALVGAGLVQVAEAPPDLDAAAGPHAELARRVEGLLMEVFEEVPDMARTELAEAMAQFLEEDDAGRVLGPLPVDPAGRLPRGALDERLAVVDGAGREALESLTLFTLLQAARHLGREAHQRLTRQAHAALRTPRAEPRAARGGTPDRTAAPAEVPPGLDPFADPEDAGPPADPFGVSEEDPPAEATGEDAGSGAAGSGKEIPSDFDEPGDEGGLRSRPDDADHEEEAPPGTPGDPFLDPEVESPEAGPVPPDLPDAEDFEGLLADAFQEGEDSDEPPSTVPASRPWQWPQARPAWAPPDDAVGQVEITSDPPGASVYLDGQRQGRTPLTLPKPEGTSAHKLEVRLRGHRSWIRTVMLGGTDTTRFHAPLSSDEQRSAP